MVQVDLSIGAMHCENPHCMNILGVHGGVLIERRATGERLLLCKPCAAHVPEYKGCKVILKWA